MKQSVHYEVEYKPFDPCGSRWYPDDEWGYERRRYRSMNAAMKRAVKVRKTLLQIEATRVVKVTREPVALYRVKKREL